MSEFLKRARDGDDEAFAELVGPLTDELTAHGYRMLGSYADAEDVVQESLTRAWRGLDRFVDQDRGLRPWLYKIVTNRCLTRLGSGRSRELPADLHTDRNLVSAAAEARWIGPYPDHRLGVADSVGPETTALVRESIRLAFVAALQQLPPRQRAVLLLREVIGLSAEETAEALELSVPAVNSALQRARRTRDERLAIGERGAVADSASDETRALADRYAAAWQAQDVNRIVALLARDVRYSMPPLEQTYVGRDAVRTFLLDRPLRSRWRFVAARANGGLAFGTYQWRREEQAFLPGGLDLIFVAGDRIAEVVSFLDCDFSDFALPTRLRE